MYRVVSSAIVGLLLAGFVAQVRAQNADFYAKRAEKEWVDNPDQAIADLSKAIRLAPNRVDLYEERASLYDIEGDAKKALADYSEAIRLAPDRPDLYEERASVYNSVGDAENALADYGEAIRLAPDRSAQVYKSRASVYEKAHDYANALADYNEAIRLAATDADSYSSRGFVYVRQGEYDKAIADFTKVIQLTPRDSHYPIHVGIAQSARASIWILKGRYDVAIADYEEATRNNPTDDGAFLDLAWLYAACADEKYRDGQKAFAYAKKAYELSQGKYWFQLDGLAAAYAECGDFKHAREWESKAIELAKTTNNGFASPQDMAGLTSRLELYEHAKPYRLELNKPRIPVYD